MRSETWLSWAIGLTFGAAAGFMVLVGGAPFLILSLVLLLLAFVGARSVALLSGAFIGVGGLWVLLTIGSQLASAFVIVGALIMGIGLLAGTLAWRRRSNQLSSLTGS